jgi:hypothetical protein
MEACQCKGFREDFASPRNPEFGFADGTDKSCQETRLRLPLFLLGDVPTKVRKTPRDLAQTRIYPQEVAFLRLPKSDCFQAAHFGGLMPTETWSFSSEKSYSPSRLICCQNTTEPFAMARNRIPHSSGPMTSLTLPVARSLGVLPTFVGISPSR